MQVATGHELNLKVPINAKRRKVLGRVVAEQVRSYLLSVQARKQNLIEWRKDYSMAPSSQPTPFDGASSIRAPFVRMVCDQHATRLNGQILTPTPPFFAFARKADAQEAAPLVEESMAAVLDEADWRSVGRMVHDELQQAGECFVRVTYEHRTMNVPHIQVEVDMERIEAGQLAGEDPQSAWDAAQDLDKPATVTFTEDVVFSGVNLEPIPFEDMILLPATAKRDKDCWGMGELVRIRGWDLKQGANSGLYDKTAVRALMEMGSDPVDSERAADVMDDMGVDITAGYGEEHAPEYREYECVELCWLDDLNDDGKPEWYVVTVHLESESLIRCEYMPYSHGRPYYVFFGYERTIASMHARSNAEILQTTQDGATACINTLNDLLTLLANSAGNFFYDARAGIKPGEFWFKPGKPQFVQDVSGILPMTFIQGIPSALNACMAGLDIYKGWAEIIGASSNPVMGKPTETRKTAFEVDAVLKQAMTIFEDRAAAVSLSWKEVFDLCRWTIADFAPSGEVTYRKSATPNPEFATIPTTMLRADVELIPRGLHEWADPGARVQRDMFVQQFLEKLAIAQNNPEVQLQLLKQVLQDLRFPNANALISSIMAGLQAQQQAMQQAQAMADAGMIPPDAGGQGQPQSGGPPEQPQPSPGMGMG